ncbi:MAG TPA: HEAT repeat domain-containing protein, partial [Chitinophagaceae bacterium]|nr:HEAT repeat domain-containing protein [Chitinophagaceae bacterium]
IRQKLESHPGIKQAHVTTVCCDEQNNWLMYIGIAEDSTQPFLYKPAPKEAVQLPEEVYSAYKEFMKLVYEAVINNEASQTDSAGYAWLPYPPAKAVQQRMIGYAQNYLPRIREVLHRSGNADHRAAAAWIIAYGSNKKDIINDLMHAVNDPGEEVRNNATRALGTLASYANNHPQLGLHVPAEPFIAMLNSIVWTDRNKGASVLLPLTETRDRILMRSLKEKALPALIDMARWKETGHAAPAFVILARMAGMEEQQITEVLYSPRKEASLNDMLKKIRGATY